MPVDDGLADLVALSDQGIPAPGVSAPPPPSAPMLPASAPMPAPTVSLPPHPNRGIDWKTILQVVAPIIGEVASPNAHGMFLNGFQRGQELAQEHQRQVQQDLEHKNASKANYLLSATEHAQGLDDPADFANFVHLAQIAGEKAGYLQPGEFSQSISFSPTKANKKRLDEMGALLDSYERRGYDLDSLAQAGASLELHDGTQVPIAQAIQMTRREPTVSGQPVARPDLTQKTEEERYVAKWASEHGKKVKDLTTAEENAAIKEFRDNRKTEPAGPKDLVSKQFDDLVELYKSTHNGQDPPAADRVKLREQAARGMAEARSTSATTQAPDAISAIGDAIISGDQPPLTTGLYRNAAAVKAYLASKHFNLAAAETDWRATQQHVRSLNSQQQVRMQQAIDNASHSLDVIEDLANEWDAGGFPVLNRARLTAAKQGVMGPKAQALATKLDAQIADVTSELGNVYMGGTSPTDHALSLASKNLSADWSKPQLLAMVEQARRNLGIRANSMKNVGVAGASDSNPYQPPPPAATAPAATPKPDAQGFIYARDKQGTVHRGKLGTPLPDGWTYVEKPSA